MECNIRHLPLLAALLLQGCAGSASHKVMTANQADDDRLDCAAIELEMAKAQAVIDGVNQDKEDLSGADVVDGLLWFPFNLIAKHQNYNDALKAADRRLAHLGELKKAQACGGSEEQVQQRADELVEQLKLLSEMHEEGKIDDAEYQRAKQKLLDGE